MPCYMYLSANHLAIEPEILLIRHIELIISTIYIMPSSKKIYIKHADIVCINFCAYFLYFDYYDISYINEVIMKIMIHKH